MSGFLSPPATWRRTALLLAGCAAAGAGLRWSMLPAPDKAVEEEWLPPGAVEVPAAAVPDIFALMAENWKEAPPSQRLARLAARLPHFTAEELASLVPLVVAGESLANDDPFASWNAWRAALGMLFTRWVELDAPGMMTALEGPALRYCMEARQLAVDVWVAQRGIVALETFGKRWPGLAHAAAKTLLEKNPHQAESLLPWLKLTGGPVLDFNDELLPALGLERYWRLALALPNGDDLTSAIWRLASADFALTLRLAKALPPGPQRDAALGPLLQAMSGNSELELPDELRGRFQEEYEALSPGALRTSLVDDYVRTLAVADVNAAAAWARALPPGAERGPALKAAEQAMLEDKRFEEATELFTEAWLAGEQRWASKGRRVWYRSVFYPFDAWLKEDPAAATRWLHTVPDSSLRGFMSLCLTYEEAFSSGLLPDAASQVWFRVGQERAFSDFGTPAGPFSGPGFSLDALPEMDRAVWREIAERRGVPDEAWQVMAAADRRLLAAEAVESRARSDPRQALDFFQAMSPEERSLGAWHAAGAAWMQQDEEAASEWMRTLPPGPERDAAATALVEHLTKSGPGRDGEAAFAWAASMSGEAERAYYIEDAARAWALEDPAAARAAVAAAPLEAAQRAALLRKLPEGGSR